MELVQKQAPLFVVIFRSYIYITHYKLMI